MEVAKYILSILRTEFIVVFSWGFNSARAIENVLAFWVQGFKHKGRVEVLYDDGWDLFVVRTFNEGGAIKEERDGIYADGLVSTIDWMVERTEDYSSRVRKHYRM